MIVLQVERKMNLVYGGGSGGLMGFVSKAVYDGGRHVLGYVTIDDANASIFFLQ